MKTLIMLTIAGVILSLWCPVGHVRAIVRNRVELEPRKEETPREQLARPRMLTRMYIMIPM